MVCPNCGFNNNDNSNFCMECGDNIKDIQNNNVNVNNSLIQNEQPIINKKSNKKIIFIIIAITFFITITIVGILLAPKFFKKDYSKSNNDINNQQVQKDNNDINNDNSSKTNGDRIGRVDSDTNLSYDKDGAFLMSIEVIVTNSEGDTYVSGMIERGTVKLNDEIQILGYDHEIITTTVKKIEMYRKGTLDSATIGDYVSIILNDVSKNDIQRGQVLAKPNSIKTARKFDANIHLLTDEEVENQEPLKEKDFSQYNFRKIDITGYISVLNDVELINPGDNATVTVEIMNDVAMEIGTEFNIRKSGVIIGNGKVTKLY